VAIVDPKLQRCFALEVVRKLREARFEAYWAGGCVRDRLLERTPKDYDVATNATPPKIREVFGYRRTLAIGAAFGVITVLGPRTAGQVEVTTFREDAAYSDGRHPDSVRFGSAREDASRRDFTINGLFYDPVEDQVLDYVGGREDLQRHLIRAIGDPRQRFAEDKLRMLRAVRFASAFGFALEDATRDAIQQMADEIIVVSGERIAMEMRRMLTEPGRVDAVRLLLETRLAKPVLPEIVPVDDLRRQALEHALKVLATFDRPNFPVAMATLLGELTDAPGAADIGFRWRLSNKEIDRLAWLLQHRSALDNARSKPWSMLQKVFVAEGIDDLLLCHEATLRADGGDLDESQWCRALLARPAAELNPPPLITGNDLMAHGIPSGPLFRVLLEEIRDAQLDGRVASKAEALTLVDQWMASHPKVAGEETG
jgi:tRNA nucleotidyltransferase/poly(A) polymerase